MSTAQVQLSSLAVTLLMMTAESTSSKCLVIRIFVVLFFLIELFLKNSLLFDIYFKICVTAHRHQRFDSQPSLVVASLDKMLHDDYLCLVESG